MSKGNQLRVVGGVFGEGLAAGYVVVARQSDAGAQFELRKPLCVFQERLFGDAPGHGSRGKITPRLALLEFARTVGAQRAGQQITVVVGVVYAREERKQVVGRRVEIVGRDGRAFGREAERLPCGERDGESVDVGGQRPGPGRVELLPDEHVQTVFFRQQVLEVVAEGVVVGDTARIGVRQFDGRMVLDRGVQCVHSRS